MKNINIEDIREFNKSLKLCIVVVVLALFVAAMWAPAHAQGVVNLGAQFGGPMGFSGGNGKAQCSNQAALKYSQCGQRNGVPYAAVGTITVKTNAEVLVYLTCGGAVVWQGERFQGTSDIHTPLFPPGVAGPCWVRWQLLNNTGKAQPDGALWEYQIAVYFQ